MLVAVSGSIPVLERYRDRELTLDGLVEAAGRSLRQSGLQPDDGRVADGVDARGVRYYQTIGVIDRPVRYDGRRAVYGYRHLVQLLAVKKLQQEGHPLPLIQRALAGRSTEVLEQALGVVAGEQSRSIRPMADATRASGRSGLGEPGVSGGPRLVADIVAPGVTITVDTSRVPDPEEVIAIVQRALSEARRS